jgi:hypothetical protein
MAPLTRTSATSNINENNILIRSTLVGVAIVIQQQVSDILSSIPTNYGDLNYSVPTL